MNRLHLFYLLFLSVKIVTITKLAEIVKNFCIFIISNLQFLYSTLV